MKKSLLTLAMIAATCGLAGAQTLIKSASLDFSDYPEGPFAINTRAFAGWNGFSWNDFANDNPDARIVAVGGQMATHSANFQQAVNVVDLGKNIGKVLVISFVNSQFNQYVKDNFGYNEDVVTNAKSSGGWIDFGFLLNGIPGNANVKIEMLFNVFDNSMKTSIPTNEYISTMYMQNANSNPASDPAGAYPITLNNFATDVPYAQTGWYYDPSMWMKYTVEDKANSNASTVPYHWLMKLPATSLTQTSTMFIKYIKVYNIGNNQPASYTRNVEMVNYTMTFNGVTGVESVEANNEEAPAEYFNLQGVRVENPTNGIYVKKQGNKMSKVMVK